MEDRATQSSAPFPGGNNHTKKSQAVFGQLSRPPQSQLIEQPFVVAPVLPDLDMQIEEDRPAEHRLEVAPSLDANSLDHLAALPDDDWLLRIGVDHNRRKDPRRLTPFRRLLELIDRHGDRVRQLVARVQEHLLADHLRGEASLGLVRDVLLREEQRALGKSRRDFHLERWQAIGSARRDRDYRVEGPSSREVLDDGQQPLFAHQVDLVDGQDDRHFRRSEALEHERIAGAGTGRGVHDPDDDVGVAQGAVGGLDHVLIHAVHGLVNAWRVEEDHLRGSRRAHADDPVTRRLRLVGHDCDLLADEVVQEGRFPCIRPADQGDVPDLHAVASAGDGVRRMRTLWMRRRSASRISISSPSVLNRSPTTGTRPTRASTYPPTVSKPSPSISTPSRSVMSLVATFPLKTYVSLASRTIGSASLSYSSRISPTSSSTTSSTVTSPAVPPYSSTTMASWKRLRWNSRSKSATRLVSGTKAAGRMISVTLALPGTASVFWMRSLTTTSPTMLSRFSE